jgi:lysyl-tRNA synthetase class 2
MAEWYRVGVDWRTVARDTLALIGVIARACGASRLRHGAHATTLEGATPEGAVWLSVAEAYARAGVPDLLGTIAADSGRGDRDRLAAQATAVGVTVQADDDWSDVFSKLLTARVEPALPADRLVVLHDYPTPEAALARRSPADPRVAERFEVYACGVELANGFGELVDPVEQRARFEAAMAEKARRYGTAWPVDEAFLAALAAMPEASGCALGFDRAVMLATGAPSVAAVRWSG